MSFFDGNYLFGGYSDGSWVPETNQEVEQDCNKTTLPDLNEEPDFESFYVEQRNPEFIYGGQPSYVNQSNPEFVYGDQPSFVEQNNQEFVYDDEPSDAQPSNQERFISNVVWETNQDFTTRDELHNWVVGRGRDNGYVIVKQRSKKKHGTDVKIWLMCDRGGEHTTVATKRRTGSKKINCPFTLIGKYDEKRQVWKLQVKNDQHNHEPAQHLEGHPFVRRLTEKEFNLVEELTEQHMEPRNILATIRKQNPQNVSIPRDIYNAQQKMKNEKRDGDTPMQVLESLLQSKQYIYYTREDPDTNVVEEIFFCHADSYATWRAFPHVLMIDATYKTNVYRLPFVQIVGVTSTHQTFCIAHAFVSKEREENYLWVLQRVKDMLQKCMEPRVIITDRELALMNACKQVFPDACKYLCRWHIDENIAKHCKASFSDQDWKKFKYKWARLCESPTIDLYHYNYNRLYEDLCEHKRERVLDYVTQNWLNPYKEMFVSVWTNKTRNFGQRTTNRVESQHRNLKRYLRGGNSTLDNLVKFVDKIVKGQEINLKESFETSKIKTMSQHNISLFDYLRGKVSHKALDLLAAERLKLTGMKTHNATCGCQLFTSCGLPCACRIDNYENTGTKIPLDVIDIFWMKLDKLSPSLIEDDEVDVEAELDRVKHELMTQTPQQKKSIMSKIWGVMRPIKTDKKAPVVQTDIRGRPSLKVQQEKKQDPPRHSSFDPSVTKSVIETQQSNYDPPRHSSFEPSVVKSKKPAMQRSRSTSTKVKQPKDVGLSETTSTFPSLVGEKGLNNINRFMKNIPTAFQQYITDIQDVKPDGNCGFRAVAVGLGFEETKWFYVRQQLVEEMDTHEQAYRYVFDTYCPGQYDYLRHSINWLQVGYAPSEHWMQMPYTGLVIAQRFGVIVHLLSNNGCQTFFPLWFSPTVIKQHHVVAFVHMADHFIHVKLGGDYPFPTLNALWRCYRNEGAAQWEVVFASRLEQYKAFIDCNKKQEYLHFHS